MNITSIYTPVSGYETTCLECGYTWILQPPVLNDRGVFESECPKCKALSTEGIFIEDWPTNRSWLEVVFWPLERIREWMEWRKA